MSDDDDVLGWLEDEGDTASTASAEAEEEFQDALDWLLEPSGLSWDEFKKVEFEDTARTGPGYGDFAPAKKLTGTVTDSDGREALLLIC